MYVIIYIYNLDWWQVIAKSTTWNRSDRYCCSSTSCFFAGFSPTINQSTNQCVKVNLDDTKWSMQKHTGSVSGSLDRMACKTVDLDITWPLIYLFIHLYTYLVSKSPKSHSEFYSVFQKLMIYVESFRVN